ncbi:lipopolysaccharide biosynthesis protein RfbH [candidate division WOR-3 bacterium]|nr:lipopolysaccharide biosynthesis protein RfbH [candidate division WOR-3 bacterium]
MTEREKEIRNQIFEKVKELYKIREVEERFIPGVTPIRYAGRVYDEKEMISLVDSALDFILTADRYAEEFELRFSEFFEVTHTILTNSGSSANLLALSALTSPKLEKPIKPGDEVITVACAFPTTVNPIIQSRLVPVFVDVELGTYNIDPSKIEPSISEKTRAIMLAHALGNPFELDAVIEIAKKYNLFVIEDVCDAVGSTYNGRLIGTFGDIGTLSFYPAHHITMGEGGALITNDTKLARIIRSFRDWGRDCWCKPGHDNTCGKRFKWKLGDLPYGYDHKYIYSHIGYNLKITDMQAAIGIEQLKKLPIFIKARKNNFNKLYEGLKKYHKYFILPKWSSKADPSWFGFPLTVREKAPFSRNEITSFLEEQKIATRVLFAGNVLRHPAYIDSSFEYRVHGSLENTNKILNNTFWIGVYPGLNEEEINYILDIFAKFFNKRALEIIEE